MPYGPSDGQDAEPASERSGRGLRERQLTLQFGEHCRECAAERAGHRAFVEGGAQRTPVGEDRDELDALAAGDERRLLDIGFLDAHVTVRERGASGTN